MATSTFASSTGAASTSATITGAASTGATSTCAAITNTLVLESQKKHCQRGTIQWMISSLKDDRDVRNINFVILLHNIKGIYAVLSRIWKCRKLRVFGANFLGQKIGWCQFYTFLQLWF